MGTSLHITAIREGTTARSLQYLAEEQVTGTFTLSFGRDLPLIVICLVMGKIVAAEFAELKGIAVFDLIRCQEYALREINFQPGREQDIELDDFLYAREPKEIFSSIELQVTKCAARPYIYGRFNVRLPGDQEPLPLLKMISQFEENKALLEEIDSSPLDRQAPLTQCTLLRRALDRKIISYQIGMLPLKTISKSVELVKPLDEKEESNLIGYRSSLLPHPQASHMPLDRFYAFASFIESLAYRRGDRCGDECRKLIYQIIQGFNGGDKGFGSSPVPARGGGPDKPLFTETTPKPREEHDSDSELDEEDPFF